MEKNFNFDKKYEDDDEEFENKNINQLEEDDFEDNNDYKSNLMQIDDKEPDILPSFDNYNILKTDTKYSPHELFEKIIDNDLLEMITEYSNKFLKFSTKTVMTEFCKEEIKIFIIINIFFSIVKLPQKMLYWKSKFLYSTCLENIMSFGRFCTINQYLHISDKFSSQLTNNKFYLVQEFINKINENFLKYRQISNYLTIDECMASFQGRIHYKQYMKLKHRKWGIKFFSLCDSFSSYTYNLIPYTGRDFNYNKSKGIGSSIISEFCKLNLPEDSHLSFDSFYTTKQEIELLDKRNIFFTGTFIPNKKGFEEFRKLSLKKKEIKVEKHDRINIMAYEDKRTVYIVSNKYSENLITYISSRRRKKTVPEAIFVYNKTKCGVDGVDQICSLYSTKRKCYKWWKSVFYYMIDICVFNASIIFYDQSSVDKSKINSKMYYFRNNLCEYYLGKYVYNPIPISKQLSEFKSKSKSKSKPEPEPKLEPKFEPKLKSKTKILKTNHYPKRIEIQMECSNCHMKRLIGQKYIAKTKFICIECNQPLCIDCFEEYHEDFLKIFD